jgi:hypothetical protein
METRTIEKLLETLVKQNQAIIAKFDELVAEVREVQKVREELNWMNEYSFAKNVIDGLTAIEEAIFSISVVDTDTA